MATLTETSIVSRKVIRYGIYIIIAIVIARFSYKAGVSVYHSLFPPKPPKPDVAFDKLPEIKFPDKENVLSFNYTLETADGNLPVLSTQAKIYYMPPINSSLSSLENAKSKASKLGFSTDGKPIVETIQNIYIFPKANAPSTLTMDIINGIFSINYDINSNPSVLDGIPPTAESLQARASGYLSAAGYVDADLQEAVFTSELQKLEAGRIVPALSLSDANLVKINMFRKNLGSDDDIPSVTPDMPEANIWFLYAGRAGTIVAAEYHYFPRDDSRVSTYPLKTSEEAWEELKNGEAFIANSGNNNSNVTIRKVYLAYYDAGQYIEYYQPVVVFEGDNDFYAYVPAVLNDYYGSQE